MSFLGIKNAFYKNAPTSIINYLYYRRYRRRSELWINAPFYLIHIPKSGGKSISAAVNLDDPGHILMEDLPQSLQKQLAHKPCLAVVREPVARLISTFKYAHRNYKRKSSATGLASVASYYDINDFIENQVNPDFVNKHYFFMPASRYINSAMRCGAKVDIIDFADFECEVERYLKAAGFLSISLGQENVSFETPDLNISLSPESKNYLEYIYNADLDLLSGQAGDSD